MVHAISRSVRISECSSWEQNPSIIVIDFPALLNLVTAINNHSGLIEFKRHLGQLVEIAVRMRAHDKPNLRFGEPDFS
jgi:hypothetical protein